MFVEKVDQLRLLECHRIIDIMFKQQPTELGDPERARVKAGLEVSRALIHCGWR